MKKIVRIVSILFISYLTYYVLTIMFDKKSINKNLDIIPNDLNVVEKHKDSLKNLEKMKIIIDSINKKPIIRDLTVIEKEIVKDVEKVRSYLRNPNKSSEMLLFYQVVIQNHYRVKGLSKEINQLLLSTIEEIKNEL